MNKINVLETFDDLRLMATAGMTASDNARFLEARLALSELIDAAAKGEPGDMVGWPSAMLFKPAQAAKLRTAISRVRPI